ncbi:nitrilase-related carbon-nitrogen hydrolase [Labedella endophytica]|uniref:Hydrolase n=1 Tax=Labedella endophytica TaxID=1523160 RepID=A0A433JQS2_9MICO|nr:nitrilase-related carbon-nitrogen hydrolase [Labedella endophytica]RUQ99114.1 hydrolase [Labedella endophytica]
MTAASIPTTTRIVCEQVAPAIVDLAHNSRLVLDVLDRAVADGADVLVLPELVTSGYVFDSPAEARSVAITPDDEVFAAIAVRLEGTRTVVVLGFCELGTDGALYNSAAVVSADGVLAVYRKVHLWDRENLVFTPGSSAPPVVETPHGRLGVIVCYDLEFPEMPRSLALAGADLIVVPTNWPRTEVPEGEKPPEIIHAQAAARSNGVFIACCDRTGLERGQAWTEGTVILDQFGWPLDRVVGEGRAVADVFLPLARDKSISPHNDLLGDRRPGIYSTEKTV